MKKMTSTLLAATLACSLVPTPAFAARATATGSAKASVRAGLEQQLGKEFEARNSELSITEAGTYVLTGNMRGTVRVDPGQGDVTLVMDNATIDGNGGPAINVVSGDSLTVRLPEGTNNRMNSSGSRAGCMGTIQSSVNTVFEGSGNLTVVGNMQPGIRTNNADLTFNGGGFNIVSSGNGMAVAGAQPGRLTINDGMFNFQTGAGNMDPGAEFVRNGGVIQGFGLGLGSSYRAFDQQNPWTSTPGQMLGVGVHMPSMGNPQMAGGGMGQPGMPGEQARPEQQVNSQPSMPGNSGRQGQPGEQEEPIELGEPQEPIELGQPDQQGQPIQQNQQGQPGRPGQQMPSNNMNQASQPTVPTQPGNNQQMGPGNNNQTGWQTISGTATTAGEIVKSTASNTAASLTTDLENATVIILSDSNSQAKIADSGTYVISGTSSDGNIVVKKGTTGVVLVLEDLDLTSTTGATLSVNKDAEVKIVVEGTVTLTDAENPEDESSTDADVADAFDGAALKVKAGSQVYITGDGTLNINGEAKNGIKGGDDSNIVIDGPTINIDAANDGINTNYDVTILSGEINIEAGDDAIHADHILTLGDDETGTGPTVDVKSSTEGLEGTVVNIFGGDIEVNSTDDAINAANKDGVYEDELDYSINMTGGDVSINSTGDGMDSNGNINLVDGSANIKSASNGGEAGIDYDGDLYISDDFQLNNNSGVAGPDGAPGQMGGQPGQMGGQMGQPGVR